MEARADAKAGPSKIDIAIAYEDSQAAQLTAADEISVQVHQKIRLEYDPPKFPSEVYMGDTTSASLNLYNKGKNTLYNVTVVLEMCIRDRYKTVAGYYREHGDYSRALRYWLLSGD